MINLLRKWLYLLSLDLFNLVLATTWYTFMGKPASSATAEIYKQAHEITAISTALYPPKIWGHFADDVYSILQTHELWHFSIKLKIFIKTLSLLWRKKVMENLRLILYRNKIMERFLYWYIIGLRILTNTYTTDLNTKQVVRKALFPPSLIKHTPLSSIKMT